VATGAAFSGTGRRPVALFRAVKGKPSGLVGATDPAPPARYDVPGPCPGETAERIKTLRTSGQVAAHRTMADGARAARGRRNDTEDRQTHGYDEQDDCAAPAADAQSSTQSATRAATTRRPEFRITPAVSQLFGGALPRRVLEDRSTPPRSGSARLSRQSLAAVSRARSMARTAVAARSSDWTPAAWSGTGTTSSPLQLVVPASAAPA
jgi:hypothetical protein